MNRHKFLGSTDLGICESLLNNYNIKKKLLKCEKIHQLKQYDDIVLLELGTLLTPQECDEIINNVNSQPFENMSNKYHDEIRNNSRLIVIDNKFSRLLWKRLKLIHKLPTLISNKTPLGFNVEGEWEMTSVNPAMRINQYKENEIFSPHKDAQYAPNGDKRSLLSLLIYLNDNYEYGETNFYFPKHEPNLQTKGLTIKEEIGAYGGLENGYECISIKGRKGFAILFSHNLLHEATAAKIKNGKHRIVLRTDVLVERRDKPFGFAVCEDEQDDYLACLNFFRQAQICELEHEAQANSSQLITIGELYERALSIRYCYPHLLDKKRNESIIIDDLQNSFVKKLPNEIWMKILTYMSEQDVDMFMYAYPEYHPLKISWQINENRNYKNDILKNQFIPKIHTRYGSQTVFRFPDVNFFQENFDQCCRVAAVYAFVLFGHAEDVSMYTVRYNRYLQEICEIEIDKLLSDVFHNRNCYGSIYRVKQKNINRRCAKNDFHHSVDRVHMMNRYKAQFIGRDLLSRCHAEVTSVLNPDYDSTDEDSSSDDESSSDNVSFSDKGRTESYSTVFQELMKYYRTLNKFVDTADVDEQLEHTRKSGKFSDMVRKSYQKELLKQCDQNYGVNIARFFLCENEVIRCPCDYCHNGGYTTSEGDIQVDTYNHLIFDFDTHRLIVKHHGNDASEIVNQASIFSRCLKQLKRSIPKNSPVSYHSVNIEKLVENSTGFNHASCQCVHPNYGVDQFSLVDYTYLTNVFLAVSQIGDHVLVLVTYNGIAAF